MNGNNNNNGGNRSQGESPAGDPMCVICQQPYGINSISFEQRLIDDQDFCPSCWNSIMQAEGEESEVVVMGK